MTTATLKHFLRFQNLSEGELQALVRYLRVETAVPGHCLFRAGDTDPRDIFLLSGELRLIAADGRSNLIIANSDTARQPIARLRPRQYTAVAKTAVKYFLIDACLKRLVADVAHAQHEPLVSIEVAEISLEDFQQAEADYLRQRRNAA